MNARTRDAGFSLVELIIAMAVMLIALVTLMVAISSASRINDGSKERAIAYELAKAKVEEMRNFTYCQTFDRIFWYYSQAANAKMYAGAAVVSGSPSLPDPLQLNPITVAGVAQPILTITFPVDATGKLTENPSDATFAARFGMPKDLNRNGTTLDSGAVLYELTGGTPPSTGYKILPVVVTVQWQSTGKKNAMVELATLITVK